MRIIMYIWYSVRGRCKYAYHYVHMIFC